MKTAEQILREIGCITEVKHINEFAFDHADFGDSGLYEEYFMIYADEGNVVGRIMKFADGTVKSRLDYIYHLDFSRNVNLWAEIL